MTECWVGLNEPLGGRALYATACNKDGTFSIPNVPAGTYELAIWDDPLDMIIAATTITVGSTSNIATWVTFRVIELVRPLPGPRVPGHRWHRLAVLRDGLRSPVHLRRSGHRAGRANDDRPSAAGDLKPPFGAGIANNIRFRDGSIYQSTTTKDDGTFAFTEVFPFFNYMVAEIDYARFKATSATIVVDDGGGNQRRTIDPSMRCAKLWNAAAGPVRQQRSGAQLTTRGPGSIRSSRRTSDCAARRTAGYFRHRERAKTGQCAILLEAMQTFLGQTNHIEWGKTPYTINENGGIAGIVYYGITRAEDDPRYAAAENWEPGIPRVQVNVFLDCDGDGKPDKPHERRHRDCAIRPSLSMRVAISTSSPTSTTIRSAGAIRNPADCVRAKSRPNGQRARGRQAQRRRATQPSATATSSAGARRLGHHPTQPDSAAAMGLGKTDSWDDSIPTGCPDRSTPYNVPSTGEQLDCFDGLRNYNQVRPAVFDGGFAFGRVAGQAELPMVIGAEGKGTYIVEAVAPPGYLHQGNGDKNVVFGDVAQGHARRAAARVRRPNCCPYRNS